MKVVKITSVLFLMTLRTSAYAQELVSYSFEMLPGLQSREERPVLVFLTADWCKYCKKTEQTSFKERNLVKQMNEEIYFVSFDIEQKGPVQLGNTVFRYNPTGLDTGVHELATALGTIDGVLHTPTFVVMNSKFEITYKYGGYLDTHQIKALLSEL